MERMADGDESAGAGAGGYPDSIEAILEDGFVVTCALGPTGALLATGSNNGNIRVRGDCLRAWVCCAGCVWGVL